MRKSNVTIEIEEVLENEIVFYIEKNFFILNLSVDKHKFNQWLRFNDKLEWILDISEAGEHRQFFGTMAIEEYYEQCMPYVNDDLLEYVSQGNRVIYKGNEIDFAVHKLEVKILRSKFTEKDIIDKRIKEIWARIVRVTNSIEPLENKETILKNLNSMHTSLIEVAMSYH